MTLPLYADHHLKQEIVDGSRRLGIDIITAYEDGTNRIDDEHLLARATTLGRVLCSEDRDFFQITNHWRNTGREFAGVIRVQQYEAGIGALIEDITLIAESYTLDEMRNRLMYVPLR